MQACFRGLICILILFPAFGFAFPQTNYLQDLEQKFYLPPQDRRMGIEVELVGAKIEDLAKLAVQILGGTYEEELTAKGMRQILVHSEQIGDFVIKVETNQTGDEITPEEEWVLEVVTPPLFIQQIEKFNTFVTKMSSVGARGTKEGYAISTQVNLEIAPKGRPVDELSTVINLLREYYGFKNFYKIHREMEIPDFRKKYLGEYSDYYMQKLLDDRYAPSARELFDDFFYRQTLEHLFKQQNKMSSLAWTAPIDHVKKIIADAGYPIIPQVVKLQSVRVSSWLMALFPDDPYSKEILKQEWAKPGSYIEFRDWNFTHDIMPAVRQAVAFLNKANHVVETQKNCTFFLKKAGGSAAP